LDLGDPVDQAAYFLARFEELEVVMLSKEVLRPGDTVVDIGANHGHFMLLAAALVGSRGSVHAFEPNPSEVERLRTLVDINALQHCRVHAVALGSEPSEMILNVLDDKSGLATLAGAKAIEGQRITGTARVLVKRGDEILADVRGPLLVKVDVEGFELEVLGGLECVLERHKPLVVMEVEPEWLKRAGATPQELFKLMEVHGYVSYHISTYRRFLRRHLRLAPFQDPLALKELREQAGPTYRNTVWIHPGGEWHLRTPILDLARVRESPDMQRE